jgi:small-conductance mechanosensitive channel
MNMTSFAHHSLPYIKAFGPTALAAAAALIVTGLLVRPRAARKLTPAPLRRRLGLPKGVVRWLVIGGLAVAALLALGYDLQGLWSTLVPMLSLVAIGFVAMWSILSHMLASILIVIFRPFEVGDRVEIIGDEQVLGEVTDLNPVYTTLRTTDGGTLQIPNNLFFQKVLKRHAVPAPALPFSPV